MHPRGRVHANANTGDLNQRSVNRVVPKTWLRQKSGRGDRRHSEATWTRYQCAKRALRRIPPNEKQQSNSVNSGNTANGQQKRKGAVSPVRSGGEFVPRSPLGRTMSPRRKAGPNGEGDYWTAFTAPCATTATLHPRTELKWYLPPPLVGNPWLACYVHGEGQEATSRRGRGATRRRVHARCVGGPGSATTPFLLGISITKVLISLLCVHSPV